MSHFSTFVSRPRDLNCCFWDILLLLAREPAFEFLRETLSAPPGATDEASSFDSPHRADASSFDSPHRADAFVAETLEGGSEAAAPPGNTRTAEDLPHAEETRGHPDLPDDGEWSTGDEASCDCPSHDVSRWSIRALRLLERSGHPTIWQMYNGGLVLFLAYRETVRFPSVWPIPGHQIRGFLLSLDTEGVAAPKILSYLSGLSYLSQTFNFQDPLQDLFTSRMIAGMRWQREPPIPLSMDTLESLMEPLEGVCASFYECLMFRAVFLLSFHAALRPREVVAKTCTTFHPDLLCMDDIEVEENRVGLHIAAPEMGTGRFTYWLRSSEQSSLCPVLALKNYLAVRPHGEGPLFLYDNWHLLCKRRFMEVFHDALRRLDLPAQRYRIHSFWLGSLTHAVCSRYPERIILHLARWPCRPLLAGPVVPGQF